MKPATIVVNAVILYGLTIALFYFGGVALGAKTFDFFHPINWALGAVPSLVFAWVAFKLK